MKKRYGKLPKVLDIIEIKPTEMCFYQDMLIKLVGDDEEIYENRLKPYKNVIDKAIEDFIKTFGVKEFINHYVYLSVKYLFQPKKEPFNRPGWHCDGFMTNDINYVWSDSNPTIFNYSQFVLTQNHNESIREMEEQANPDNNISYENNTLIRLDQYNVHKVSDVEKPGMRAFVKVTFSKDKYDLKGNTHNYLINYNWEMKDREIERNVPQSNKK